MTKNVSQKFKPTDNSPSRSETSTVVAWLTPAK
jgi:hypothetical protein